MTFIKDEIKRWLADGNDSTNSHLIVVCDTFDYEYYPVYVKNNEDVKEKMGNYNANTMQKIMEVYDYSLDLNMQLNEGRSYHTDTKVKSLVERPTTNNDPLIPSIPILSEEGKKLLVKDQNMKINEEEAKRLINPKEYLEEKITPDNCQHLVVIANGFDDYNYSCNCLICESSTNYSKRDSANDRYISRDFGFLTPYRHLVLKAALPLVCKAYENEEAINIVAILNKLNLEKIEESINTGIKKKIKRIINNQKGRDVKNAKNS